MTEIIHKVLQIKGYQKGKRYYICYLKGKEKRQDGQGDVFMSTKY